MDSQSAARMRSLPWLPKRSLTLRDDLPKVWPGEPSQGVAGRRRVSGNRVRDSHVHALANILRNRTSVPGESRRQRAPEMRSTQLFRSELFTSCRNCYRGAESIPRACDRRECVHRKCATKIISAATTSDGGSGMAAGNGSAEAPRGNPAVPLPAPILGDTAPKFARHAS
jgi:hypothetical protein